MHPLDNPTLSTFGSLAGLGRHPETYWESVRRSGLAINLSGVFGRDCYLRGDRREQPSTGKQADSLDLGLTRS